jgi:death-on-curing protein
MNEPVWITLDVILSVQEELVTRFGGLPGLRDEGLLESAMNRPVHLFHYGQPDIFTLAAQYTFGIVKNHPFLDGNKRAGFMACYIVLGANGHELDATEEEATNKTLALAAGEMDEAAYAAWLKDSCR